MKKYKSIAAIILAIATVLPILCVPIYATEYRQNTKAAISGDEDNHVIDCVIDDFKIDGNQITGALRNDSETIPFQCSADWYEVDSKDKLDGTLIANITEQECGIDIYNISIGLDHEAMLNGDEESESNEFVIKIVLLDVEAAQYYSAAEKVEETLLSRIQNMSQNISEGAALYSELVNKDKWYNNVFSYEKSTENKIEELKEKDIANYLKNSTSSITVSDNIPSHLTSMMNRVGVSKFKVGNKYTACNVAQDSDGRYGYYLETFDEGTKIISYIIFYELGTRTPMNSGTTGELSYKIRYNHEIWYYPSTGQFEDWGECPYRIRYVHVGMSLTDSINDHFIEAITSASTTNRSGVSVVTFLTDIGLQLVEPRRILPTAVFIAETALEFFSAIEYGREAKLDCPDGSSGDYAKSIYVKTGQGLNDTWFMTPGDYISVTGDVKKYSSSKLKYITYEFSYDICSPNFIGWYSKLDGVKGKFDISYY